MDMGTGLAIFGPSLTVLGIGWKMIDVIYNPKPKQAPNEEGEANGFVRRGEWKQACKMADTQSSQITNFLERLEEKIDKSFNSLQACTEDLRNHDRRLAILEHDRRESVGRRSYNGKGLETEKPGQSEGEMGPG